MSQARDRADTIRHELSHCNGSEEFTRHWTGRLIYTEGIARMAELCGAFWLIDAVASYVGDRRLAPCDGMEFWKLKVDTEQRTGLLSVVRDSGEPPLITQQIDYTDFPLDEIDMWVECGTMMLPSER